MTSTDEDRRIPVIIATPEQNQELSDGWNPPGSNWPRFGKLAVVCAARLSEELRVIGVGAGRAGVHGGCGEPAYLVEQVCFGVVGQVMGVGQGEVGGAPDHAGAPEFR